MEVESVLVPPENLPFEFMAVYDNCHDMALVGSFNDWNKDTNKMHIKIPGLWSVPVRLDPGVEHEFRFIVDGCRWTNVPHYAVNTAGNHVLRLPAQEVLFEVAGEDWEKPQIAGTFTSWTQVDMSRQRDSWVYKVYLHEGDYQFKFVKAGNWVTSPTYRVNADGNNVVSVGKEGAERFLAESDQKMHLRVVESEEKGEKIEGNGKEGEVHYHFHIEEPVVPEVPASKDIAPQENTPSASTEEHNEGNPNQPSQTNTAVNNHLAV
eukprot:TRINITY_DN1501_c0_g1_i1.p1 TRINITY_DN1501_c0_g1~~TRINITY_DN1501_c0_g1_i1.p1  ORF type:complete len:264 (+),score=36.82 TRINITY_DN1501_c0_g1_i1:348-1139(+)